MSCASRWHSRLRTFHQEVGSFPIGRGVGGGRNLSREGGRGAGVGVAGLTSKYSADAVDGEQDGDDGIPERDGVDGDGVFMGVSGDGDGEGGVQVIRERCSCSGPRRPKLLMSSL
jgi:hypothetical protein